MCCVLFISSSQFVNFLKTHLGWDLNSTIGVSILIATKAISKEWFLMWADVFVLRIDLLPPLWVSELILLIANGEVPIPDTVQPHKRKRPESEGIP